MAKEYIEREVALRELRLRLYFETADVITACDAVCYVPAADVRPVVHGRWVLDCGGVKCTACGEYPEKKDQCYTPFCCLCGAVMDEEVQDG